MENAESYLEALFFDARRYDVSKVGRYKFNKKMDIWSRLCGQLLAEPVADPMTGEILAMPGDVISREKAHEISARGVNEAIVEVNGTRVKVFSNGMVDMANFVDFDPAEYGIREKVCFAALKQLLDTVRARWLESSHRGIPGRTCCPSTSPGTISSLRSTISTASSTASARRMTLTTWATAACAAWVSCCRTSSASALPAWSASSVSV